MARGAAIAGGGKFGSGQGSGGSGSGSAGSGGTGGSGSGAASGSGPGSGDGGSSGPPPVPKDLSAMPGRVIGAGAVPGRWLFVDSWYLLGPFGNAGCVNLEKQFPPGDGD